MGAVHIGHRFLAPGAGLGGNEDSRNVWTVGRVRRRTVENGEEISRRRSVASSPVLYRRECANEWKRRHWLKDHSSSSPGGDYTVGGGGKYTVEFCQISGKNAGKCEYAKLCGIMRKMQKIPAPPPRRLFPLNLAQAGFRWGETPLSSGKGGQTAYVNFRVNLCTREGGGCFRTNPTEVLRTCLFEGPNPPPTPTEDFSSRARGLGRP